MNGEQIEIITTIDKDNRAILAKYANEEGITDSRALDRIIGQWDAQRRDAEDTQVAIDNKLNVISDQIEALAKRMRFLEHHLISQTDFE